MKIKYGLLILYLLLISGIFSTSYSEVIYSSRFGFSIKNEIIIDVDRNTAFKYFSEDIGKWWQDEHTYSQNAENMYLELHAGGCFCEKWNTGSALHLSVVYVDSGKTVRMTGGLGPLQSLGLSGSMSWSFIDSGKGTKLILEYNVSGFTAEGLGNWAAPVDGVLRAQLESLKLFAESVSK